MTWTLRFYDGDGTEIGWVTADPWTVQITHPDAAQYEDVRVRAEALDVVYPSTPEYRNSQMRLSTDPAPITDPEAHLEAIRERLAVDFDFTFSLTDE